MPQDMLLQIVVKDLLSRLIILAFIAVALQQALGGHAYRRSIEVWLGCKHLLFHRATLALNPRLLIELLLVL